MAPTVTREMSVVYGSVTVGGTSDVHLDGVVSFSPSYRTVTVSFTAHVASQVEATFVAACNTLTDEFRKPRQRLRVILGASTWLDYNPATNTGFNAMPTITLDESRLQTGRSAFFVCNVAVQVPADLTSNNGLDEGAKFELRQTPSGGKELRITGVYTALSANDAYAQFVASYATLMGEFQTSVGGTYDATVVERAERDQADKNLSFSISSREILSDQRVGATNDSDIVNHALTITDATIGPGDADASVRRLRRVSVSFSAWISKSIDMKGKFPAILNLLASEVKRVTRSSAIALLSSEPAFNESENRIDVSQAWSVLDSTDLLRFAESVSVRRRENVSIDAVYGPSEFSADVQETRTEIIRTIARSYIVYGGRPVIRGASGNSASSDGWFGIAKPIAKNGFDFTDAEQQATTGPPKAGKSTPLAKLKPVKSSGEWIRLMAEESEEPIIIGISPYQMILLDRTEVIVERWVERFDVAVKVASSEQTKAKAKAPSGNQPANIQQGANVVGYNAIADAATIAEG